MAARRDPRLAATRRGGPRRDRGLLSREPCKWLFAAAGAQARHGRCPRCSICEPMPAESVVHRTCWIDGARVPNPGTRADDAPPAARIDSRGRARRACPAARVDRRASWRRAIPSRATPSRPIRLPAASSRRFGASHRSETDLHRVADRSSRTADAPPNAGERPGGTWKPWFPVIDYSALHELHAVPELLPVRRVRRRQPDGKIQVRNQDNCKTECPACSRVCPEVAIMFPKYRHGPINGDEVNADDIRREAMKVDISALLGGDVYSAAARPQREGQVAILEGTRRRAGAERAAELPA